MELILGECNYIDKKIDLWKHGNLWQNSMFGCCVEKITLTVGRYKQIHKW